LRWNTLHAANDSQQAGLAQHLPIRVAGFNQGIRVTEQAVAGIQLHVELLVLGFIKDSERQV